MVYRTTDTTSKAFILSCIETARQDLQGIKLSEFQTNFLCLRCYVLNGFTAIDLDYFVFSWAFQQFE